MKNNKIYSRLFKSVEEKAEAFDCLAEHYYDCNFGGMSKSDVDLLMFQIYYEKKRENSNSSMWSCSDYEMSKELGITQARASSLKLKSRLAYPDKYKSDWREELAQISGNAVFEDGKVKLMIPDRNLFLEIKNAVEVSGGFVDVQLTSGLLQVRLPYFLDLMVAMTAEENREEIKDRLLEKAEKDRHDLEVRKSFGALMKGRTADVILDLVCSVLPNVASGPVKIIAQNVIDAVKNSALQS